jgi:hypothetical protein
MKIYFIYVLYLTHLDPFYTVPDSLVTTSSFAAEEQCLTTKVHSFDNDIMFLLVTTIINV